MGVALHPGLRRPALLSGLLSSRSVSRRRARTGCAGCNQPAAVASFRPHARARFVDHADTRPVRDRGLGSARCADPDRPDRSSRAAERLGTWLPGLATLLWA